MGVKELIGRAAGFYSGAKSVFVSQELVQKMQGGRRAVVIYNGVNVDIAKGSRPPEYGSRVNLVAVGRLEPVKGLQYLIEAVSDPVLRSRVHLHLVGEGPELNGLQDLVMRKQLGSVVSFHGFKANSTDYIAHADILVLPSLHEGVPYVLLEALALKTPVMASEVGGIPEIVRHRKEAVLFSAGSADELARVLRQTIPDAELLAGMRSAGYFRVNSQFSAKAMTERYAALYASLGA
jgi:glycosyltransferase involved in cell wall biosynthesis